jgi:hypothetical protein
MTSPARPEDGEVVNVDMGAESADERTETTWVETGLVETPHFDPNQALHFVRAQIAFRLLWILAGTIFVVFLLLTLGKVLGLKTEDVSDVALPIFSALMTLVSTCVGFYFGGKAGEGKAPLNPTNL